MAAPVDESRRGFLKVATAALGALVGALAVVPGLGFLAYPLRERTVGGGEEPTRVASLGDLRPGRPQRVNVVGSLKDAWLRLDGQKLGGCWLVKQPDGRVRAFSTVCPHLGCGVDWNDRTRAFECPCHGSVFGPDGRRQSGPTPRDLDELAVETSGDDVRVSYRRFRLSVPRKEPLA